MSTKKICIEIERTKSISEKVEILEVFDGIITDMKQKIKYIIESAETFAETGLEYNAELQYENAKHHDYVLNIIERIASEI